MVIFYVIPQFYHLYRHHSLCLRSVVFLFTYLSAVFRLLLFAAIYVIKLIVYFYVFDYFSIHRVK